MAQDLPLDRPVDADPGNPEGSDVDENRDLRGQLRRRERELTILSEVVARVHGEEDERVILDIALDEILGGLDVPAAWVLMAPDESDRIELAAQRGVAPEYLKEVRAHGLGECLCSQVFSTGQRMLARNTTDCPRLPQIVAGGEGAPVTHASIPLLFDGTARGVLNVAAPLGQRFSDKELRFLETLGHQVCLAMERARHLRAERLRNLEARAMASINKAIGGSLDADAVLKAVGDTAREVLGADRARIFLGTDARNLRVAHLSGLPQPDLRERQVLDLVAMGASLQASVLQTREACAFNDWRTDDRVNHELAARWGAASGIVVPLLARDQTLGLLVLSREQPHVWTSDQIDVAEALAGQASVALENVRLYEEARRSLRELKGAQARIIRNEKMAVLGTFASGLAHEVRNPLNSIGLQLSLLERRTARLAAPLSEQLRDVTRIIHQEVMRLDSLVNDFLLFSRAKTVQYRPAHLESLLDEVVRLLRPEARAAGVTLRRHGFGERGPSVPMDEEKIKQVVINLVRNAIEAMPDGGNVVVEDGMVGGRACVVVRDDGPGLPEGLDVFQVFVTTKPRGTGLGLSIAQQIVLEHNGEISADSAPGGGATFKLYLPAEQLREKALEASRP
jgi:signal transduction histidine kinase